jgi:hypothetical protein
MKTLIKSPLTLEEVAQHFDQWRIHKKKGERIPPRLWSAAIGLLSHYPISKITRTLRLSGTDLKKHQGAWSASKGPEDSRSAVSFVEIDCAVVDQALKPSATNAWLELARADGLRLRIQPAQGADLLAVVERFMET